MRSWRKIYASTLESADIADLSDGAIVLFIFLIVAQDDSGYYPWNDTKVRRLCASRPEWTRNEFDTYRNELVQGGLVTETEGGIVLVSGEKLNGLPRPDVKAELYPRIETVTSRIESVPLEQSRVEQSREREEEKETHTSSETSLEQVDGWWLPTLQTIPGWEEKGDPHLTSLLKWVTDKNYSLDDLEKAATGLSKTRKKTLEGYTNFASAFQDRLNKGYDSNTNNQDPKDQRGVGQDIARAQMCMCRHAKPRHVDDLRQPTACLVENCTCPAFESELVVVS